MGWKQLSVAFKNNSLYLSIVVYHEYKIDHILMYKIMYKNKMYFYYLWVKEKYVEWKLWKSNLINTETVLWDL